ncbi:mitochondrial K+-H+ exchange-related-domain-containing protein [Pisolithus marmoratus]|nr:mitochondrial K+-H+ exchange-related-domain-containing protein [Pisolithus marmoratus]
MSLVPKPMPSLRIIALPLAAGARTATPSRPLVNRLLVYYHFNVTPPHAAKNNKSWSSRVLNRLTTLRLFQHGERLVDRIDFEELALKGVDPIFLWSFYPGIDGDDVKIPLIYPPSVYSTLSAPRSDESMHHSLSHLRVLLDNREPRHRRGFYLWMLIAPLTIPLAIVPVIPNIPFFFCAWRSWSHYRAYKSSQYLSSLIDQGFVRPEPNQKLDEVYRSFSPPASKDNNTLLNGLQLPSSDERAMSESATDSDQRSAPSSSTADNNAGSVPHRLLLSRKAVPRILELFSLPDSAAADMYRAMEQVRVRLQVGPR